MSQLFYAGKFPGCSRLWAQAVPCNTNHTPHFHIVDGGQRLNDRLELESQQKEIPLTCKKKFAELIMASNQEMGNEIKHLPWQCYNCTSSGVRSPVLEPEAAFCLMCSEDKLASAEAVLMSLSQTILTTWLEAQHEAAGNAIIKVVSGKELRMLAWSPHNRANSGLLEIQEGKRQQITGEV